MKKGAMFGLDARIALAIFGALSVILGAALYSAIQEAKNQQIISMFSEISKALRLIILIQVLSQHSLKITLLH